MSRMNRSSIVEIECAVVHPLTMYMTMGVAEGTLSDGRKFEILNIIGGGFVMWVEREGQDKLRIVMPIQQVVEAFESFIPRAEIIDAEVERIRQIAKERNDGKLNMAMFDQIWEEEAYLT